MRLANGDRLSGVAKALNDEAVELDGTAVGAVHLPRPLLRLLWSEGGALTPLSGRKPAEVKEVPQFDESFPFRTDRNLLGEFLTIAGQRSERGLGCHVHCELDYELGGEFSAFISEVGIDGASGRRGAAVFRVLVDGKPLADSGTVHGGEPAKTLVVALAGAHRLRLVADLASGVSAAGGHADWGMPVLVRGVSRPRRRLRRPQASRGSMRRSLVFTGLAALALAALTGATWAGKISWPVDYDGEQPPADWQAARSPSSQGTLRFVQGSLVLTSEQARYHLLWRKLAGSDGTDEAPLRAECQIAVDGPVNQVAKGLPTFLVLYWNPANIIAVGIGAPNPEAQEWENGDKHRAWAYSVAGSTKARIGGAGLASGSARILPHRRHQPRRLRLRQPRRRRLPAGGLVRTQARPVRRPARAHLPRPRLGQRGRSGRHTGGAAARRSRQRHRRCQADHAAHLPFRRAAGW